MKLKEAKTVDSKDVILVEAFDAKLVSCTAEAGNVLLLEDDLATVEKLNNTFYVLAGNIIGDDNSRRSIIILEVGENSAKVIRTDAEHKSMSRVVFALDHQNHVDHSLGVVELLKHATHVVKVRNSLNADVFHDATA